MPAVPPEEGRQAWLSHRPLEPVEVTVGPAEVLLLRHELLSERVLMNALSVLVERERSLVATLLEAQGGCR